MPACACAGEINTIQGNLNWVSSREHSLKAPVWNDREEELLPLCNYQESDSANLDHLAEFLISSGTEACQSLMALVPEAFNNHPDLVKHYPKVTSQAFCACACCGGHGKLDDEVFLAKVLSGHLHWNGLTWCCMTTHHLAVECASMPCEVRPDITAALRMGHNAEIDCMHVKINASSLSSETLLSCK